MYPVHGEFTFWVGRLIEHTATVTVAEYVREEIKKKKKKKIEQVKVPEVNENSSHRISHFALCTPQSLCFTEQIRFTNGKIFKCKEEE